MTQTKDEHHNPSPAFDLCVLVPAFNERSRIGTTLLDIIETLNGWDCSSEILVVNDGSNDDTVQVCTSILAEHRPDDCDRVISLEKNMGKGAAVAAGLRTTRSRWTIMMDADNSARLGELDKLAACAARGRGHLVIGSRRMPNSQIHATLSRVVVGTVYTIALRMLGLSLARDTQCGFKLYSNHAANLIAHHAEQSGFSFDIEHLLIAKHAGLHVPEVGIQWDHADGSKVNPILDGLKMLGQIIQMRGPIRKRVSSTLLPDSTPLVLSRAHRISEPQIEVKPQKDLVGSGSALASDRREQSYNR